MTLLDYQLRDLECDARFSWSCWSRQTGKSFTKSLRRLLRGIGRRRTQIFLSASERQSRELMEQTRKHCRALRIAAEFLADDSLAGTSFTKLEIRLSDGVRIVGLPANPRTARGYSGDVLLDEFAMHVDDRAIWASLFPTLLRGGGELDIASTPRGCSNTFARLRDNPLFQRTIVTLPDAVAAGLEVDIETIRRSMNDEQFFRQEFLCEFLDESTALLTYEQIAACEDESLDANCSVEELAARGEELFVGVDIGRRHDLTVIWVLTRRDDCLVTQRVTALQSTTFRQQYDALRDVLALRRVRRCCIDAGGLGMQLAEAAQEDFGRHRVEAVTFTLALKAQLAGRLRVVVEEGRIRIPANEAIRNDWHGVQRVITAGGQVRYEAPRNANHHADRFWAAALAVHAADSASAGWFEFLNWQPAQFTRRGAW